MEPAAITGAQWVVGKALSPLSDGLVEAWAATSELGPNIEALKMELLYAQAMLENARGREIPSQALGELLQRLRGLAYGADDVLDELDYFRIQDELEGTFEAAVDDDGRGCFHNLVRDGRHTAKAAAKQLGCCSCSALIHDYKPEDPCKCVRRLASRAHAVGKRFLCSSPQLVRCDGRGDDNRHAPRVPKLKFDRVDVSRKMKCIVEQLKPVCSKVSSILDLELLGSAVAKLESLGSNRAMGNVASSTTSRSITTSQALEPKLYGREPEKKTIVEDITRGAYIHRDLTVVPIVGPGGIGKTTLTQDIYNSQEVQDHFQIRVWICVSLDFSVYRLTQEILSSIPKAEDEKNERTDDAIKNLDQLQKLVQRRLKNKRFLLVLDDIWSYGNEDEWKRFLVPFTEEQGKGNIVLATTRFLHVAEIVKKGDKSLPLEGLGPKDYWRLFLACVFDERNQQCNDGELLQIGKMIVEKLKGSPLAAKTVGRLLRKNLTVDHWTRVLESKEWESQTSDHDIMPALKLSYDFLPFQLQQCFSCWALFPEDYKFDCEELIHFWIGLDILRPSHTTKRIEEIGRNNLNELVSYGFFIEVTGKSDKQYVMHDLLHDLALKVSSQECLHLASSSPRPVEIAPSIYHLSISLSPANSGDGIMDEKFKKELGKIKNILKSENLHTLMLFGDYDANFLRIFSDLFKDAKKLRVVHLSTMYYSVESLLHNFSKLIHLRYLRLVPQFGSKEHLPSSISRFYQLRVLDIRRGSHSSLRDMSNLVKLRHFLSYNVEHHSNISNVGKLDSLQELQRFEVRKESNGFELRELGHLEELGGSLGIYNLENVQASEAHEAKLMYKRHLQKLTLSWNKGRSNTNPDVEDQILESLRPHSNLHEVCIDGHGGVTCPTWLGTNLFTKGLEALRLDGVAWKSLPPLGEMWLIDESGEEYFGCIRGLNFDNLRRLELIGLPRFRKWVANEVCPWYFSLIEELTVEDCPELTELPFSNSNCYSSEGDVNGTCFPRLTTLKIWNCEKLLSLPPLPYGHTLCSVSLRRAGRDLKRLSYSNTNLSSFLTIEGNDDLPKLDETVLAFQNLTQLQELYIADCPPLAEKHLQMLTSLKTLEIDVSRILFLPLARSDVKWQVPVNTLMISNSEASGKELTRLLSRFPELFNLEIRDCEKITRLGIEVEQQKQIAEDVVTEDAVAEQDEEEDGLLLLGPRLTGSLQELWISSCSKLVLTSGGGGLQAMCSLTEITIQDCPKFLSAYKTSSLCSSRPFPSSLQRLWLVGPMEGMETLAPLSNLTSLEELSLANLGEDLRCEGLWPLLAQGPLKELYVWSPNFFAGWDPAWGATSQEEQPLLSPSSKLQELSTDDIAGVLAAPICRLLSSSLTKLSIVSNKVTERFTKEQENALSLLSSLQELELKSCDKLRCLPAGLNKLTNLHRLQIWSCPAIRSLPKNGLPSSLQELDVSGCKNNELTQRCRRLKETIPNIIL